MPIFPKNTANIPPKNLPRQRSGFARRLRSFCRLVLRWFILCIAATMAITILFRWVPLPCSSLMIQRQISDLWQKDKAYRFRYRWVDMGRISPYAPLAVIASEDQKFLDHMGFDFDAMEKAWEHNQRRKRVHGASTISQQLAKNLFLWPGRSFLRKGMEVYFTLLLEGLWPKRRIIEVYLNVVEFGPGIFGIEAASQAYFHKSAAKLNPAEAAILAAILPSPLRSNAARPSGYISERAWHIQQQMRFMGGLALLKPLGLKPKK